MFRRVVFALLLAVVALAGCGRRQVIESAEANPPKPAESKQSGFQQYNTNESLYERNQPRPVNTTARAFALLGVPLTADWKEITLAYRAKAKEFHPDKLGGDDSKMIEINQAYATLRRVRGM